MATETPERTLTLDELADMIHQLPGAYLVSHKVEYAADSGIEVEEMTLEGRPLSLLLEDV